MATRRLLTAAGVVAGLLVAALIAGGAYMALKAPLSTNPNSNLQPDNCSPGPCANLNGYVIWISNVRVQNDIVRMTVKFQNSSGATHAAPEDLQLIDQGRRSSIPVAGKRLAQPDAQPLPQRRAFQLVAERQAGSHRGMAVLDRAHDPVLGRDDEPFVRRPRTHRRDDLVLVAGLLEVEVQADLAGGDVEELVERQRLVAELVGQLGKCEVPDRPAAHRAVVVADDRHAVARLAHVELDVVDAELDRVPVTLGCFLTGYRGASSMRADQRHT